MGNKNLKINVIMIFIFSFLVFSFSIFNFSNASTYISDTQKQIIRDTKRLNDITVFRKAIEDYKNKNGYYPKLETGTNIKGYVNSAWSSQWNSFCNLVGLSSCPNDPINEIVGCDCSIFNSNGNCVGDNINSNIDKTTCYNSKSQSFACYDGSRIYQYQSLNNGRNYSFNMDFEYSDNVDWQVSSSSPDNFISVKGGCISGQNIYKVFSNKLQKCGDGILSYSEVCEVGSKKTEYCKTPEGKMGIRYVNCSNSCLWDYDNVGSCITVGFCGDGIIQSDKGEECDGGYQKMCYNYQDYKYKNTSDKYANDSHHDWYLEQIRYCGLNCKWSSNFIDNTSYCGGFCGDGSVQKDRGEECDDPNDIHCDSLKCKNKNSGPKLNFDFINNRNSKNSYIKSSVWSGDNLQYSSDYNGTGNNDLVIADKQSNVLVAIWNSDFIEIKIDGQDIDGDVLNYKYEFDQKYNIGIKIKYKNSSGLFVDYKEGDYVQSNIIRVYPVSIKTGSNKKNINGDFVFDSSYVGFYSLKITTSDLYNRGINTPTNVLNASDVYSISFKIGSGCGDRYLDVDLGEQCEFKPGQYVTNIFTDWILGKPDDNSNNYCVVSNYTSGYKGKWDDVSCGSSYYGLCERRASFGCDGWIVGQNNNCYKFTSKSETWYDAKTECESYSGKLATIDTMVESQFLKNSSLISSKNIFWLGYKRSNSIWYAEYGSFWRPDFTSKDSFRDKFYGSGLGINLANQYSCGLPWESDSCRVRDGFCGDAVTNPMFEQCDKYDKSSYGKGSSSLNPYECDMYSFVCNTTNAVSNYYQSKKYSCGYDNDPNSNLSGLTCRYSGGYCGDSFVESVYEHCDPKDRIISSESSNVTFGNGVVKKNYVCRSVEEYSDNRSNPYNDYDDYLATKNNDVDRACRKSYGGYCGDGKIQMFYSLDANSNYVINSSNVNNQTDSTWKNIKFDGINKKHYRGTLSSASYFTTQEENMLIEECDPLSYGTITPDVSFEGYQYGGCGSNLSSSDPCNMVFDSNNIMISYTGNCACRKLQKGFCGDGILQNSYLEKCELKKNGKYDIYFSGELVSDLLNLSCTSSCGYVGDGWTCENGYYWKASEKKCKILPSDSYRIGTLHGGDDFKCDPGFKRVNETCEPCAMGTWAGTGSTNCQNCTNTRASNQRYSSNSNTNNCSVQDCLGGFYPNSSAEGNYDLCSTCSSKPNSNSYWTTPGVNCNWTCNSGYYDSSDRTKTTKVGGGTNCDGVCGNSVITIGENCDQNTGLSTGEWCNSCIKNDCTNKPENSYYTGYGGTSNSCSWGCNIGYYKNGSTCSPCPAGTYGTIQNAINVSQCSPCPAGAKYCTGILNITDTVVGTCPTKNGTTCDSSGGANTYMNCLNKPTFSYYTNNLDCSYSCNDQNYIGTNCVLRTCDWSSDYDYKSMDCQSNGFYDYYFEKKATSNCVVPGTNFVWNTNSYSVTTGAYQDVIYCRGDQSSGNWDCARVGDISPNACTYCTASGGVYGSDRTGCNNHGTRNLIGTCNTTTHNVSSTAWGSCSCDLDWYGTSCESQCSYGTWGEVSRVCQSNGQWKINYSRSVTGSNCAGGPTTSNTSGGSCTYKAEGSVCKTTSTSACNDSSPSACPAGYSSVAVNASGSKNCGSYDCSCSGCCDDWGENCTCSCSTCYHYYTYTRSCEQYATSQNVCP